MRRLLNPLLWIVLLLLSAGTLVAERRFPPPDFETDYSFPEHRDPPARAIALGYTDVAVLAAALGLASYLALKRRSRDGMLALAIGSLLYFGFYRKGCVCSIGSIQNVALAAADPAYALPWVVLAFFLLPLVFALFFGRTFCAGVCPLGAIQDLVVTRPIRIPRWLEEGLGLLPYLYLGWAVLLAATRTRFLICEYDPFVGFFRMDGPAGKILFGGVLLLLGLFVGRPYCRFLCPYSVLLRQAARLTRRHLTITPTECIQCQLCEESCPFAAIDQPTGAATSSAAGLRSRALAALALGALAALLSGWTFSRLAPHVVQLHPVARAIAQRVLDADGPPAIPEPLIAQVAQLEERYRAGGWWVGALLGLVVGGRLLRLSIRRRRDDFEVNRPSCVSCLRCVRTCPKERVRLGIPVPGLNAGPESAAALASALRPLAARCDGGVIRRLGMVSAVSVIFFLSLLAWNHREQCRHDPLLDTRLAELRAQLATSEEKEAVRETIRRTDLESRQAYFRHQAVGEGAGTLLLWSAVLLLIAGKWLHDRNRPLPLPAARLPEVVGEEQEREGARARWMVAGSWGLATAAALAIGWIPATPLTPAQQPGTGPGPRVGAGERAAPGEEPATEKDIARNWPRFRGPDGLGLVTEQVESGFFDPLPAALWETEIPLPGFNSPVVWEGKVLLTGADESERAAYCVDGSAGTVLWTRLLPPLDPAAHPVEVNDDTGFAAPTMATDGHRAFALFANGDLFALDLADGRVVWSRAFGLPENHYGHATSLAVHEGLLLVQLDQAYADDAKSALYGLETASGQERYRVLRPVDSSWTTPIVARAEGAAQLITAAAPWLIAYRPQDGSEIWRAQCVEGEMAPSPAFANGIVFAVSPYNEICGVRTDGSGEVTETHVVWKGEEGVPDITSPLADGRYLWTVTTDGALSCWEMPAPEPIWQEELEEEFFASPTLCAGRLVVVSSEGRVLLFEAGSEFKAAGRIELERTVRASPAFGQNRMYVRTERSLISLGKAGTGTSGPDVNHE